MKKPILPLLTLLLCMALGAQAQFQLQNISGTTTFNNVTDLVPAPHMPSRIYVVQKGGLIEYFEPGTNGKTTFLDISARTYTSSECGVLGLAFPPNFPQNDWAIVHYNTRVNNATTTRISKFYLNPANPQVLDAGRETVLLAVTQPYDNHNGGRIEFGPDSLLYIALGDGGSGGDPQNNAQNLTSLLGKILRLDVLTSNNSYVIPASNPFVGISSARGEIYAYGLRNPWKFSHDRLTGTIWAADVGQNRAEEIDTIVAGGNYGWRLKEGFNCYNPSNNCITTQVVKDPVIEYATRNANDVSVTGGYVYRGSDLPPLTGAYIFGDYGSGRIWQLAKDAVGAWQQTMLLNSGWQISTFGQDQAGEILVGRYGSNRTIYKLINPSISSTRGTAGLTSLSLHPNPARHQLQVSASQKGHARIVFSLYDLNGRLIKQQQPQTGSTPGCTFDLNGLAPGTYVVQAQGPDFVRTQRLVKE